MNNKHFFQRVLLSILFCLAVVASFNYATDPLWLFNNFVTTYKNEYNERMQKTNLIVNNNIDFEGIIIGSSRSSALNIKNFDGVKMFNYSVSSLIPQEYGPYINIAKKVRGQDLKVVVMGLDFFSYINEQKAQVSPESYYKDANSIIFKVSSLISYDTFKKGKKNIGVKFNPGERYYSKDISIITPKRDYESTIAAVSRSAADYKKGLYKVGSKKVSNYKDIFIKIKEDNPNTKFVVFTTPVSKELLRVLTQNGLHSLYEEWLTDIVDIFGEVNHFMYLNEITNNYGVNFYDGHHFYTTTAELISMQIKTGCNNANMDFGMKINKSNLLDSLIRLRELHNNAF